MSNSHFDETIKKEFSHIGTHYFNSAYFGPCPLRAKSKVEKQLQKELDPSFYPYNSWMGIPERIRIQIAELLGVKKRYIVNSTSVTDINNIIANGVHIQKGDVICTMDGEYPSNVLPYMVAKKYRDFEFKLLKNDLPDADWLKENLPVKTKVFIISHIAFNTGRKIDLISIGKLMRERDILFVVDATQSLGGLQITKEELELIDVLAVSCYKWLLGPYGYAFAYFNERALKNITAQNGNWIVSPNSKVVHSLLDYTTETLPGARKFDRGQSPNMLVMSCLEASLELFSELKIKNIEKHNSEIRDYFLDNFPKNKFKLTTPKDAMGNIVAIKGNNVDSLKLEAELKFRNVDVSVREGNIRLSFHLFNSKSQVDQLIKALDSN